MLHRVKSDVFYEFSIGAPDTISEYDLLLEES